MSIVKIFQNNRFAANYSYRVAETLDDIKTLSSDRDTLGSEIYVISERKTYICDGKGTWTPKSAEGDSVTCDCVEESTIWETLPEPVSEDELDDDFNFI